MKKSKSERTKLLERYEKHQIDKANKLLDENDALQKKEEWNQHLNDRIKKLEGAVDRLLKKALIHKTN